MDKVKILEYFDASKVISEHSHIHVIGCGAIGSHIAEQLARIGCTNIHLWDFDTVSPHNITNQMFNQDDIGAHKVIAIADTMYWINQELQHEKNLFMHTDGWHGELLNGYVFLCVDNIDLRREIVLKNQYNPNCIAFFDFRMRLTDAQHYMAECNNMNSMKKLLASMNFTHDEAKDATPKSACNTELSVITTVKCITALGVNNFIKLTLGLPTKDTILIDLNLLTLDSFPIE